MKHLSEFSAAEFQALWLRYQPAFDELSDASDLFREYREMESGDTTAEALAQDAALRSAVPEFFQAYPYLWTQDPHGTYLHSSEASLQYRLTELLITCWRSDWLPLQDRQRVGDVALRQVIIPTGRYVTPQAVPFDGHGLILLPIGWFDTLQYATEAVRLLAQKDLRASVPFVLESIVRTLADHCVRQLALTRTIAPSIGTILRFNVARDITTQNPIFAEACGDLNGEDVFSGGWTHHYYAATTFAIAHELAHVLTGEHLSGQANEDRADTLAAESLMSSPWWLRRMTRLGVMNPRAKTFSAFVFFAFVNRMRLTLDSWSPDDPNPLLLPFLTRTHHMMEVFASYDMPEEERSTVLRLADGCQRIISLLDTLLLAFRPGFDKAVSSGMLSAQRHLDIQANLRGGVR